MDGARANWLSPWVPSALLTRQVGDMIGFSLRTFLASMLALYVAFALQLESPLWAWLTAYIVAQPTPGMALSKSLWRVVGTVSGSIIGVVLIALFAQTPELFVLALATVVGTCTFASNIMTNFRAYATVLAGYTAGIIASDAINSPDQVFFIGMARASCILIGIASTLIVTSIFAPHRSEAEARGKIQGLLKEIARRAAFPWNGREEERLEMGKKIIAEIIALNTTIEYAAAESADFRIQTNRARSLLAHILGVISARRSLDAHLARRGWPRLHALVIFHEVILDFLHEMPDRLERGELDDLINGLGEVRQQLALVRPEEDTVSPDEVASERLVVDRLDDLLGHLDGALKDWRDIVAGRWSETPALDLNFHRDQRAAAINGLRAFIAVCATGAFWIGSAWTHGPGALIFVSIMLSLFSSVPRPDRVGWAFFKASVPAVFAGLACKFFLLPASSGFEYLALSTSLVLLPLGLVMGCPATMQAGVAFSLVFLNVAGVANPMVYDVSDSINSALAIEFGVLAGTLSYVLIFPPDPRAAYRYVTYRIRRGLGLMASLHPIPDFCHWETRMYDRVQRLYDPQNLSGTHTNEWFEAGLGALTLGNEILRVRRWLQRESAAEEVREAAERVIVSFGGFVREPVAAARAIKAGLERVSQLDPGVGKAERRSWARILGALREMDVFLDLHPRLLRLEEGI